MGTKMGILSKGTYASGPGYQGWFLVYNGTGSQVLQFFRGGSPAVQTPAPANDRFVHVVVTFDGITLLLFVDGTEVASSTTVNDLAATGAPLTIGNSENWGTHQGAVDEVAIYGKPLSPARVKLHYQAALAK
jgi:hypothetical protein